VLPAVHQEDRYLQEYRREAVHPEDRYLQEYRREAVRPGDPSQVSN
jgi:hypothetical protein